MRTSSPPDIDSLFEGAEDEDATFENEDTLLEDIESDSADEEELFSDDSLLPTLDQEEIAEAPVEEVSDSEEFDLGLDLEDIDMESLSQEIDEVSSLSGDDAAEDELPEDLLDMDLESMDLSPADTETDTPAASEVAEDTTAIDDFEEPTEDADDVRIKMDLAKAYMDMGDMDGAREILQEILEEGDEEQQNQAKALMENL